MSSNTTGRRPLRYGSWILYGRSRRLRGDDPERSRSPRSACSTARRRAPRGKTRPDHHGTLPRASGLTMTPRASHGAQRGGPRRQSSSLVSTRAVDGARPPLGSTSSLRLPLELLERLGHGARRIGKRADGLEDRSARPAPKGGCLDHAVLVELRILLDPRANRVKLARRVAELDPLGRHEVLLAHFLEEIDLSIDSLDRRETACTQRWGRNRSRGRRGDGVTCGRNARSNLGSGREIPRARRNPEGFLEHAAASGGGALFPASPLTYERSAHSAGIGYLRAFDAELQK